MATVYYLIALTLLLGVVSGQNVENFEQSEDVIKPLVGEMVGNPYICESCENIVGFLKNLTENKQVLDDLVTLLLPLCDWAPYAMHSECVTAVDNIPAVVKMYADMYLNPQTDCQYLCQQLSTNGPRPEAAKSVLNYLSAMKETAKKYK